MDHLAYYNLKQEPFSIMPLTDFYYHNEQHDEAHLRLKRAIESMKGLALLVGDAGTGKTLLARRLLETLPEDRFEVSLLVVLHSDVDSFWLIRRIALQFGIDLPNASKVDIISALYDRLSKLSEEGKQCVILIDEAHMLRNSALLEELRGLLNLELPTQKLLTFVLFGMPELDENLKKEPSLAQRIAVRFRLKNFSPEVVADYVKFRLSHAGCEKQIFSQTALEKLRELTNGNPRLINVVCDNAMFEGFVRKKTMPLDEDLIRDVAADIGLINAD